MEKKQCDIDIILKKNHINLQ